MSNQYVSASVIHPVIQGIIGQHLTPGSIRDEKPAVTVFKQVVIADLKDRFCKDVTITPAFMASALDPRFKMLSFLDRDDARMTDEEVWHGVQEAMALVRLPDGTAEDAAPPAKKQKTNHASDGLDFLMGLALLLNHHQKTKQLLRSALPAWKSN